MLSLASPKIALYSTMFFSDTSNPSFADRSSLVSGVSFRDGNQ